jgi:hypothetical protein
MPTGEGPEPCRVHFAPGEQLLLYTGGVTEARDETAAFSVVTVMGKENLVPTGE